MALRRTEIDQTQTGNVDTQRMQTLIEAADGGASICAGGFNIFGRNPISPECQDYLEVATTLSTAMTSNIGQAFITGPISGFNTQAPEGGKTSFKDVFGELLIPLAKDRMYIQNLEVNLQHQKAIQK